MIAVTWSSVIAYLLAAFIAGSAQSELAMRSEGAAIQLDPVNLLLGLGFAFGVLLAYLQLRGRDR